jgi:adenylate cyclase
MLEQESALGRRRREAPLNPPPTAGEVSAELERIFASADFDGSPRSRAFLRFIVEETHAGRQEDLTQTAIATRVFGRRDDFDPTIDPIVRIQAGRLRRSLERYYLLTGAQDPVRIELPRGSYVPVVRWAGPAEQPTSAEDARKPSVSTDDWPIVVVSEFEPVGLKPELDDAAARFLDHLTVELGRYRDVRVVLQREPAPWPASRGDGTLFALSGRFSRGDRNLRLTVRLVDCRTGDQVWADDYWTRSVAPIAFREETARVIAARVASEQGAVARLLWAERRAQPPTNVTAYGGILASYQFFFNREPADFAPAVAALQHVVAAEPERSLAWVQLSRLYTANYTFEASPLETPVEQAVAYAEKGVRLDPTSQRARAALAGALLVTGELTASRAQAQSALDLNPDSLVYLEWIGWLLTLLGEWELGPDVVRRALARNPHVIPVAHHALWLAHLRRGEHDQAHQAALQYHDPTFFWKSLTRACSLGHLGRVEEARVEVAELLRQKPDFAMRGRTLIGRLIKFPDLMERVVDGLSRAGLELE